MKYYWFTFSDTFGHISVELFRISPLESGRSPMSYGEHRDTDTYNQKVPELMQINVQNVSKYIVFYLIYFSALAAHSREWP